MPLLHLVLMAVWGEKASRNILQGVFIPEGSIVSRSTRSIRRAIRKVHSCKCKDERENGSTHKSRFISYSNSGRITDPNSLKRQTRSITYIGRGRRNWKNGREFSRSIRSTITCNNNSASKSWNERTRIRQTNSERYTKASCEWLERRLFWRKAERSCYCSRWGCLND